MTGSDPQDLVAAARRVALQLDARGPALGRLAETLCRALKVQEEAGELAEAISGVLGQNPRKGVTHTWEQVIAEAIDVSLAALVLAETVASDLPDELTLADRLDYQLDHLRRRAAASGAPEVANA